MAIELKCPCGKTLRVADQLAGKKVRCPVCSAAVRVPPANGSDPAAQQSPGQTSSGQSGDRQSVGGQSGGQKGSGSRGKRAAASSGTQLQWYVQPGLGSQWGPCSKAELDQAVRSGTVDASCQVWCEGWSQWKWASDVFAQLSPQLGVNSNPLGIPATAMLPGAIASPLLHPMPPQSSSRPRANARRYASSSPAPTWLWVALLLAGMYMLALATAYLSPLAGLWIVFGYVAFLIGLSIVGGIWGVVVAFEEGVEQGLLYLFLPLYALYYLITRWDEMWKPSSAIAFLGATCENTYPSPT